MAETREEKVAERNKLIADRAWLLVVRHSENADVDEKVMVDALDTAEYFERVLAEWLNRRNDK